MKASTRKKPTIGTLCNYCGKHLATMKILLKPCCDRCALNDWNRYVKEAEATDAH